jgi:dynein heavy chain, axonemal
MIISTSHVIYLVILFSVGFTSAKVLAMKIVYLYNLSHRQLSQQDHYDFGMRAIKAVLLMAGEIKRSHRKDPTMSDEQSEVKSIVDMQRMVYTHMFVHVCLGTIDATSID